MLLDASLTLLDQQIIQIVPTRNSRYVFLFQYDAKGINT